LYGQLVERHGISGLRALSRAAFERQFSVPGLVMFCGSVDDEVVGLHLWYVCGDVAYGHLGATSARGYEFMASYALGYFRDRVRWLDLGGAGGVTAGDSAGGLERFKAGWATGTRPTFVCGRILQPSVYAQLAAERGGTDSRYFPSYRYGEFRAAPGPAHRSVAFE
jgi:hypothetical protein